MNGEKTNTDYYLVKEMKKGNCFSFGLLYEKYSTKAFCLALKYLQDKDKAEDIVQNVFIKIWENRKRIDEKRPFNRYFFTVLKNMLLDTLKSKKRHFMLDNAIMDSIFDYDLFIGRHEAAIKEYRLEKIKQAAMQLPRQRQRIFKLKYSGAYTNQQIADMLDVSINTIKHEYYISLKQIRSDIGN